MIKVSGNFAAKLDRWADLAKSCDTLINTMSRVQAEVSITLIGDGFTDETDPYGEKWKPKKKPDGRKVLHGETSRLRTGWHVTGSNETGFQVDPSVDYAGFHQGGTTNMVARKMVPTASRGLPKEWAAEFRAVAISLLTKHFGPASDGTAPAFARPTVSAGGTGSSKPAATSGNKRSSGGRKLRTLRTLRTLRSR